LAEAKPKRTKRANNIVVPVVRDSTFHRAVVDNAFVFGTGNDVEIACLQSGPNISSARTQSKGVQLDIEDAHTEVVRLRLSWPAATALAMNILTNGIRTERLSGAAILEEFTSLNAKSVDDDN
jgi:hypothetical protein